MNLALVDIEAAALENAEPSLRQRGVQVASWVLDVSDRTAMLAAGAEAVARFGGIDLLVNNAGVGGALGPSWDLDQTDWTWTLEVNVMGVVNGLAAVLPSMVRQGAGHVLNIASLAGVAAPPFLGPYTASKHAVVGLTEGLATELSVMGNGVGVSVACPGVVTSGIASSERNRPARLAQRHEIDPALKARLKAAFDTMTAKAMPAALCAAKLIEGIEEGRLYILTHEDSLASVLERVDRIRTATARAGADMAA